MDRKTFIQQSAMGTLGVLVAAKNDHPMQKNLFVHHVYFWLKEPQSKEVAAKLVEGLEGLSKVKTIQMFHIGKPADTNRDVIDRSYAISWLVLFKDKADQDAYQVDPIHLKFVEQYSHLWAKVVVYDSVDVK
jgi:Stress responsive A/B Barrel Domain